MERFWFVAGSVLAFLGVAAGAFGAHALRGRLSSDALDIYETAARYHLFHALALIVVAYGVNRWGGSIMVVAGWLFLIGVVLFCGSLYALAFSGIKWLGAITPIGGVAFLAGWVFLALAALKGG